VFRELRELTQLSDALLEAGKYCLEAGEQDQAKQILEEALTVAFAARNKKVEESAL